jgi:hypothetical protein
MRPAARRTARVTGEREQDVLRHLADLRTRTYEGRSSREERVTLFRRAVDLVDPLVRRVLGEVDEAFLDGSGTIARDDGPLGPEGDLAVRWALSWPDQRAARNVRAEGPVGPIEVVASFLADFNHPHLRGSLAGHWPFQVVDEEDAARQEPVIRAIVEAELHQRIFEGTWRVVPGFVRAAGES